MATTITNKAVADATTERVRDLNERVLDASKKIGVAYLDAVEQAWIKVADYQDELAQRSDVDFVADVTGAQAKLTREFTGLYVSTGRELLK